VTGQSGASRIVDALQASGVECVFGLPGTQTLELFEALRESSLRTVIATNELNAAFMAGGWAKVTGRPGVILTISGPGFMWALNGVAEARLDSIPLLHISGAPIDTPVGRRSRQQELPQAEIAAPLVKGVIEADQYSDPGLAVLDGLELAYTGEPGPVLLHVSSATLRREFRRVALSPRLAALSEDGVFAAVCARMHASQHPIFIVGQGTNTHGKLIAELATRIGAPVLTTPSARGVLPEDSVFNVAFDPFAGDIRVVNELVQRSDLIVAIGCKLGHASTAGFELKLPPARLIHIDASAEVVGANYPASLTVIADAGDALRAILNSKPARSSWTANEIESWRARAGKQAPDAWEPRVAGTPARDARNFFETLRGAIPREAILVLDSGLHQILARRYYTVLAAAGLIMPTDLQSMGFAIPTAIGARLASPERVVIALLGDGGFAMTALALLSAAAEGISLVVVVFVDGKFGQIRMQQLSSYGVDHGVAIENPDMELLAAAVGARYELVDDGNLADVIRNAVDYSGVTVVEVIVGDTHTIRVKSAVNRVRETTRRVAGPQLFGLLAKLFRGKRNR
jgi:acetolactate synthase I/II/III large subunit